MKDVLCGVGGAIYVAEGVVSIDVFYCVVYRAIPYILSIELQFFNIHLNSDGQQFLQYQQDEQVPFTSNHWTQKKGYICWWNSRFGAVNGIPTLPSGYLDLQQQYRQIINNLHFH